LRSECRDANATTPAWLDLTDSEMSPIIKLVDTIIYNAMESRASDIHIETRDTEVQVKYRIDGALYAKVDPIDLAYHQTLISRIKVMSELDIAERRVPQDGRFRVKYMGRLIDFRVSIMPSIHGEDAVLRVLDKESMSEKFHKLTLDVVGFSEEDLKKFRLFIADPYGMVLLTGPPGSGKTTTLYASLSQLDAQSTNICSVEDPVEIRLSGIAQVQVNPRAGITFASAVRAFVRQDPNTIVIGELRDAETAAVAISAALAGQIVFTTLHANDAARSVDRLLICDWLAACGFKSVGVRASLLFVEHCVLDSLPLSVFSSLGGDPRLSIGRDHDARPPRESHGARRVACAGSASTSVRPPCRCLPRCPASPESSSPTSRPPYARAACACNRRDRSRSPSNPASTLPYKHRRSPPALHRAAG